MRHDLTITANFRIGPGLPAIEEQYRDLWRLALLLQAMGFPLEAWCPPADTPERSTLNAAFDASGPSAAALAMARADKDNHAADLRSLGVWNGREEDGAIVYATMLNVGRIPSNLRFSAHGVPAFADYRNVVRLVQGILDIWRPMLVQVDPGGYGGHEVFKDRPGAAWMIYLPLPIKPAQVPEAAHVIPVMASHGGKGQQGALIVTVADAFDAGNPAHVRRANAVETRLVDQDLLPTRHEFVTRFP